MEDNQQNNPDTFQQKRQGKISKKLEVIVFKSRLSKDLPKNITEQLTFVVRQILNQKKIVFYKRFVLEQKEWVEVPEDEFKTFLLDVAIKLGVDENKIQRKATITKLYNEFCQISAREIKRSNNVPELPVEAERVHLNPLQTAHRYIQENYPNTSFNTITERPNFGNPHTRVEDIIIDLKMKDVKISHADFETYLYSDKVRRNDPFLEYFESDKIKNGWNKDDPDYIEQLASHVKTDNQPLWSSMLKKHLVRAVIQARADKEFANRFVLVLRSTKESLGKSTFIRYLNPFGSEYFIEHIDNNMELAITKAFIINLEEIESLNKVGFNKLKALISLEASNIRRLYTQTYYSKPRRCSFFASTNELEFLGGGENSRWIIFNVVSISFDYSNKSSDNYIDINKVWAQATYLANHGFDYNLTPEEKRMALATSKEHRYKTNEEEYITEWLQPSESHFATATAVAMFINNHLEVQKVGAQKVGSALKAMGYNRIKKEGVYGYMIETREGKYLNGANIITPYQSPNLNDDDDVPF